MPDVNVDLIINGQATGEVANQLVNNGRLNVGQMRPFLVQTKNGLLQAYISVFTGGNPKDVKNYKTMPIQTNATLRRDEWKQLDDAVLGISQQRLTGIDDLIANNLTYNLGNGMGTTVLEWHDVSDALEASLTMDGVTRGNADRPNYQHNYLPLPIIHADYEINARVLAASRNMGNPLDTTLAERAARKVSEKLEAMLFTDTTYGYGEKDSRNRNSIYSYLNYPDRNLVHLSIPWDNSAMTGAMIMQDVREMKQANINAYHYGPYMLYIPTNYETVLDDDYDSTTPGTTIRERIMKISGIKGIKVVDKMPQDNVLLVQMTSDVVRLVRGMGIQNVEWEVEGKMITKYKVMTIQVPQIRSDQAGKCGVVHMA
jgi:hypothetical protein